MIPEGKEDNGLIPRICQGFQESHERGCEGDARKDSLRGRRRGACSVGIRVGGWSWSGIGPGSV